jgi:hypothetical protein
MTAPRTLFVQNIVQDTATRSSISWSGPLLIFLMICLVRSSLLRLWGGLRYLRLNPL